MYILKYEFVFEELPVWIRDLTMAKKCASTPCQGKLLLSQSNPQLMLGTLQIQ